MPELRIYGYSDDLLEVEGYIRKEFDCYDTHIVLEVKSPEGEILYVHGEYSSKSIGHGWIIGVSPQDVELSNSGSQVDWPISIVPFQEHGYSMILKIEVPEGTTVKEIYKERVS